MLDVKCLIKKVTIYDSPLGRIFISCDDNFLLGLWFENQKFFPNLLSENFANKETNISYNVKRWLDLYFDYKNPNYKISLRLFGTSFQQEVWQLLCNIPYGHTVSYREIAQKLAIQKNILKMSAQAVGNAVSHNNISIIIPCHRVVGSNNSLVGYAGGIDKKLKLLSFEGIDTAKFYVPKN